MPDLPALLEIAAMTALAGVGLHGLIWLVEHHLDPTLPLRAREEARVRAIERTLEAVRTGLIKVPRV